MNILNLKKKTFITAFITSLLFVACGKDDATKPNTNNAPFTFLKVGNEWEFGRYDVDTDTLVYINKLKVVSENNGYFKVIQNNNEDSYNYYFIDDNGWYINKTESEIGATFILPLNCYVGKMWDETYNDYGVLYTIIYEIVSVSETVIVPAGTIKNCIKVKTQQIAEYEGEVFEKDPYYSYYHKDIGMVIVPGKGWMKLYSKNF